MADPATTRQLPRRRWRSVLLAALVVLGAASLGLLLRRAPPVRSLEWSYVDVRTRMFTGSPDERIVLAEIQDGDVEVAQQEFLVNWPWPLDVNADVFQFLAAAEVQAVVVDVLHLDRGAGPDDHALTDEELSDALKAKLGYEAESASAYGEAMRDIGNVALAFELTRNAGHEVPARREAAAPRLTPGLAPAGPAGPDGLVRPEANLPVRRVIEGARLLGFANAIQDADDLVRRAAPIGRWGETRVLSLAYAGALLAEDATAAIAEGAVRVGDVAQALTPDGSFLVNFRGEPGNTYPRVAPAQILMWAQRVIVDGEPVPEEATAALAGKIVVWGVNLPGQRDLVPVPTSGNLHAPEFQATVIDNLLHGDGRVPAAWWWNALFLVLLVAGVSLVGATVPSRRILGGAVLAAIVALVATTLLFFGRGVVLDGATPLVGVVGIGVFWHEWIRRRERVALAEAASQAFPGDLEGHTLLDVYRVESRLGAGGMATVHLAVDTNLGREVVVKVPHLYLLQEPGATERFKREVETLIRFQHPSIIRILAQGTEADVPFFILEYASGGSLGDVLTAREGNPMAFEEVMRWLRPLASALDYVHERGVVHRDVKPDNVLLDGDGNALLSDFGLMKALNANTTNLTQTGVGVGSPTYMAPEQAEGDAVSPATDQYALASVAYEALVGHCPFEGEIALEVLLRKVRFAPPPMGDAVTPAVAAVVLQALAIDPTERFASCTAFVDALDTADREPSRLSGS